MKSKDLSENTKKTTQNSKNGAGSFWISKAAIDVLINKKASAEEICTYLILSRFVDKKAAKEGEYYWSAKFSTAGLKSMYTYAGLTAQKAKLSLEHLYGLSNDRNCRLIQKPEKYNAFAVPHNLEADKYNELNYPHDIIKYIPAIKAANGKRKVRWVLNTFGGMPSQGIWLPNELVDGVKPKAPQKGFQRPLKKIIDMPLYRDEAARFILLLYLHNDLSAFGGVDPKNTFYIHYDTIEIAADPPYSFCKTTRDSLVFAENFVKKAISTPVESHEKRAPKDPKGVAEETLQALLDDGFLFAVVKAMHEEPNSPDLRPRYELAVKHNKFGYTPPASPFTLSQNFASLFGKLGIEVGSNLPCGSHRFNGQYPFVVKKGQTPNVMGIFRLRYELSNPKNHPVTTDQNRREIEQREALEIIETIESSHQAAFA